MAKIEKVWFDANRIYMLTDEGEQLSRPLEAFPVLKDASEQERLDFFFEKFGFALKILYLCTMKRDAVWQSV